MCGLQGPEVGGSRAVLFHLEIVAMAGGGRERGGVFIYPAYSPISNKLSGMMLTNIRLVLG